MKILWITHNVKIRRLVTKNQEPRDAENKAQFSTETRNLVNLLRDLGKKQRAVTKVESLIVVTERNDSTPLR